MQREYSPTPLEIQIANTFANRTRDELKAIYDDHIQRLANLMRPILNQVDLPSGFRDDIFVVTGENEGRDKPTKARQYMELMTEALTNRGVMEMVRGADAVLTQADMERLFPTNTETYRADLAQDQQRISKAIPVLDIKLPDNLQNIEAPTTEHPFLLTMQTIKETIAAINKTRKNGNGEYHPDQALAWIKGGTVPLAAAVVYGRSMFYPSLTVHRIAEDLEFEAAKKTVTLESARKYTEWYVERFLKIRNKKDLKPLQGVIKLEGLQFIKRLLRIENGSGPTLEEMSRFFNVVMDSKDPFLSDTAKAFKEQMRQYFGDIQEEYAFAAPLAKAVAANELAPYSSDLDIGLSLSVPDAKKVAQVVITKLQEHGFEVQQDIRSSAWDEGVLFYDLHVTGADGVKRKIQFHLNPNDNLSRIIPGVDTSKFIADIAQEMSGYHAMRIVTDGEDWRFFDPFRVIITRGTRVAINPFFVYTQPNRRWPSIFYLTSSAGISGFMQLTKWDRNYLSGIAGEVEEMSIYGHRLPDTHKFFMYAIHGAQKILDAQRATGLLDAFDTLASHQPDGKLAPLYERYLDILEQTGIIRMLGYVTQSAAVVDETLHKLQEVYGERIKLNFPPPDESSSERATKQMVQKAGNLGSDSFDPRTEPGEIPDNLERIIEQ